MLGQNELIRAPYYSVDVRVFSLTTVEYNLRTFHGPL